MRTQRKRFAGKQVGAPQAVLHVSEKREPGWTVRIVSSPVPGVQDSPDHVLVDVEGFRAAERIKRAGRMNNVRKPTRT
jgi:hypothetical protein